MIRRPPRSTLLSLHDALPISRRPPEDGVLRRHGAEEGVDQLQRPRRLVALVREEAVVAGADGEADRKSTRLNSSHLVISYAVFCLKKKKTARADLAVVAVRPL